MVIHALDEGGNDVAVGVLRWAGGRVVADPAGSPTLQSILYRRVQDPASGDPLTARDGERFLAALPYRYGGSYLRAELKNGTQPPPPVGLAAGRAPKGYTKDKPLVNPATGKEITGGEFAPGHPGSPGGGGATGGATSSGGGPGPGGEPSPKQEGGGKAGSAEFVAGLLETIQEEDRLAPDQRADYSAAVTRVAGAMNDRARELLAEGVREVTWHPGLGTLTADYQQSTGGDVPPGRVVNGFFSHGRRRLVLDGHTAKRQAPGMGGEQTNVHGTYAHEMTHAIDYGGRFSNTREWQTAFLEEIVGERGSPPALSEYARLHRDPAEGMAEFGRALWGSDVPAEVTVARFPKCAAFFKANGLLD